MEMLKYKKVKQFTREELQTITDNYLDACQLNDIKPMSLREIQNCFMIEAQAKALYHFLWAMEHILDQMIKLQWDPKDLHMLIKRMERAGYDPYSITEDTAGIFIESRRGHGFKTVKTADREFTAYDPRGYDEEMIADDSKSYL